MAALPLANPGGFASYFGSVAFLFFIHFTLPAIESSMVPRCSLLPTLAAAPRGLQTAPPQLPA